MLHRLIFLPGAFRYLSTHTRKWNEGGCSSCSAPPPPADALSRGERGEGGIVLSLTAGWKAERAQQQPADRRCNKAQKRDGNRQGLGLDCNNVAHSRCARYSAKAIMWQG